MSPLLTLLVSVACSGAGAAVVTAVLAMPKSARSEMRDLRKDLTKCEGDCAEAKDEARRARIETDEWRRRVVRAEEEADRWRLEAEHWKKRWEDDHDT